MTFITLPTLSIRQPWAWLIFQEHAAPLRKDIENRSWPLPARFLNTPVLIQSSVSAKVSPRVVELEWASRGFEAQAQLGDIPTRGIAMRGCIVGAVVFSECIRNTGETPRPSPWCDTDAGFWWRIQKAIALPPITAKGQLNFWKFDLNSDLLPLISDLASC